MLLQVSGIIKRFGVDPILDGVNLQILERERIGLVGVNGAGKSTLLKIVAGEMSYDGGQIFKSKETTLGYLAQNSGLQSDRSIWEEMMNVFAHLTQAEADLRQMERDIADPAQMEDEKNMLTCWNVMRNALTGSRTMVATRWKLAFAVYCTGWDSANFRLTPLLLP